MHVNLQFKSGVTGSKRKFPIGHLTYTYDQCSIHPALSTSKETHSHGNLKSGYVLMSK